MEALIAWKRLEKLVKRFYPNVQRGRPLYPLAVMIRIHCVQLFYNLSDPAMEDMLYEIESVRRFVAFNWPVRFLMRRQSSTFDTCWRSMDWVRNCFARSTNIWMRKA